MSELIVVFHGVGTKERVYYPAADGVSRPLLRDAGRFDKQSADATVDGWLVRNEPSGNPYWKITAEPAPFDGEKNLTAGSFTYRCYRYKKDVLGLPEELACTTPIGEALR